MSIFHPSRPFFRGVFGCVVHFRHLNGIFKAFFAKNTKYRFFSPQTCYLTPRDPFSGQCIAVCLMPALWLVILPTASNRSNHINKLDHCHAYLSYYFSLGLTYCADFNSFFGQSWQHAAFFNCIRQSASIFKLPANVSSFSLFVTLTHNPALWAKNTEEENRFDIKIARL
jgi:hypothetical protein